MFIFLKKEEKEFINNWERLNRARREFDKEQEFWGKLMFLFLVTIIGAPFAFLILIGLIISEFFRPE